MMFLLKTIFFILSILSATIGVIEDSALNKDLYAVLGISKSASLPEIKAAFKKLAKIHHPDKSTASNKEANAEIFRQIAQAYEILSDSSTKEEYDTYRSLMQSKTKRPTPALVVRYFPMNEVSSTKPLLLHPI
jgi:curved DNA-binding protein CbpA